jgi:hypothetical protein
MYSGGSDVEPPTGPAAEALILPHWLDISESAVHGLATEWKAVAGKVDSHGSALRADRDTQAELIQGATGDEHYSFMTRMMHQAYEAADMVDSRAVAAADRAEIIHSDKTRMKNLAEIAQADWDAAEKSNVPGATAQVIATYAPEVAGIRAASWERFNQVPPLKPVPRDIHAMDNATDERTPTPDPRKGKDKANPANDDKDLPNKGKGNGNADTDGLSPTPNPGEGNGSPENHNDDVSDPGRGDTDGLSPTPDPGQGTPGSVSPGLPVSPLGSGGGMPGGGMPSGGSGGGGAPRMPGGGLSGLGSSFKPPATPPVPSSGGGGGPTSPAQALSAPLTNASSSFQSGVASGMGASGAVPPAATAPPPPQPLAPFVNHPAVANAVPASTGFESGAAPGAAAPAGGGSAPSGGGMSGGAPMGGGGGVMPPPVAGGAAPAAPYSAAGAGAAGIAGGAAAPTAGSPAPAGAGSAPAAQPAATPMVAGGSGAATASGLASVSSMNPDMVTARQVLEGLVKGSLEDNADLIVWAVSVLRTPAGPQTVVASSVGGGAYIPPRVFPPVTARLATADRTLPIGWAAQWMGWKSPVDIVIDHAHRFLKVAAGVRLSAIATCDLMATRPARQVVEDFVTVHPRDILLSAGPAPGLDGSHHHRLTALDPGLAARIAPFNRRDDKRLELAAGLTAAVIRAAMDRDETGKPLANDHDAQILDAVSRGVATAEDWQRYDEHVKVREDGGVALPSVHGPRDVDESDASRKQRSFYSHLYRVGRIVELVKCWQHAEHVNVADVAYCGVAAGYAPVVMATLATLENGSR